MQLMSDCLNDCGSWVLICNIANEKETTEKQWRIDSHSTNGHFTFLQKHKAKNLRKNVLEFCFDLEGSLDTLKKKKF